MKRDSLTWLVIACRCGLKKKSLWLFLSWNCNFYIICMDARPCVHGVVSSVSRLKGLGSSHVQKWVKSGVESREFTCAYLGKGRAPTWLLPIRWSASKSIRAAPGFCDLQRALVAFFSLWLTKNGSFFVTFPNKFGEVEVFEEFMWALLTQPYTYYSCEQVVPPRSVKIFVNVLTNANVVRSCL